MTDQFSDQTRNSDQGERYPVNSSDPHMTRSGAVSSLFDWISKYRLPIAVFAITRLGLFILVWLSVIFLPVREGKLLWRAFPNHAFLDGWFRWDAGWYCSIVEHGYTNFVGTQTGPRDTLFWPLYPVAVRIVKLVVG